jgi:hypothetical protein
MVRAPGAALAAVRKGERTQRGTVVGAIGGHGISRKKVWIWDFWGSLAGGEAHFSTELV